MTDEELVRLIDSGAPEEWTLAQIDELRRRVPHSPVLRAALAGRVEIERYLIASLAPWTPSVEAIVDRALPARVLQAPQLLPVLGAIACVALLAFLGVVLIVAATMPPAQRLAEKEFDNDPMDNGTRTANIAVQTADSAAIVAQSDEAPPTSTADQPPAAAPRQPLPTPTATAAPPLAPAVENEPWNRDGQLARLAEAPATPFEQPGARTSAPSQDELRKWLVETPAAGLGISAADRDGLRLAQFEGLARLRSPWPQAAALRLCLYDYHNLKLHFWNGARGVTLQFFEFANDSWAAYVTQRDGSEPRPGAWSLAATDQSVHWRTNPTPPTVFDIRLEDGRLILSRGDIRIVEAPFAGTPSDVFLEGRAVVRQIGLVRANPLSPPRGNRPTAQLLDAPAGSSGWMGQLPEGAFFEPHEGGGVRLRVEKIERQAWVAQPLPTMGLFEWIVQLENPQPGTGLYLGDAAGEPKYILAFFRERQSGQLAIGWLQPGDGRMETQHDLNGAAHPFVGPRPWIKLLVAGGMLRCQIGVDGEHWGRCIEPWPQLPAACESIGLCCPPRAENRSIHLRRLEFRAFAGLNALADAQACRRAVSERQTNDWRQWNEIIDRKRPEGLAAPLWRRACALRTLAGGASAELSGALVERLAATALRESTDLGNQLQVLDEAAELAPTWDNAEAAKVAARAYDQLGKRLWQQGEPRPYEQIRVAQISSPLWCRHRYPFHPESLMRTELYELAYTGRWQELAQLCQRIRMVTRQSHPQGPALVDWGLGLAARALPKGATGTAAGLPADWRGPLTVDLGKESFNVLAEIEAAVSGNAYEDACQVIASAQPPSTGGLLPDRSDPQLLLSLPLAIGLALGDHPPLAQTMVEKFSARARLRVRQAIAEGDAEGIEAIPLQFMGTAAAAEAHQWLGDRALAAGQFAVALGHYRQARPAADVELAGRLAASEQLALALAGQSAPDAAATEVQFGEQHFSGGEFAKLLDEIRAGRATGALSAAPIDGPAQAPAPSGFSPQVRGRVEGEVGEGAANVPGELQQANIDWTARQLAVSTSAGKLYVSNRFHVAAYDLADGRFLWRTGVGGEQGYTHDWSMMAMPSVVTNQLLFVRRLQKAGPQLAALAIGDGHLVWQSPAGADRAIVSDPLLQQDQLIALAVARGEQESRLLWLQWEPLSGAIVQERPLARLHESWWQARSCQVAPLPDGLLVACGGSLLRVGLSGELIWSRSQTFVPPALDRSWMAQAQQSPLVDGPRAILVQPSAPVVAAINLESGRRVWQHVLPGVQRLLGVAGPLVMVQSDEGVVALQRESGKPAWRYESRELLDAFALDLERILLARTERVAGQNQPVIRLAWLNALSGQPVASTVLQGLSHEQPRLGPLVTGGGKCWTFFGRGAADATRDLMELLPQGEAERIAAGAAANE